MKVVDTRQPTFEDLELLVEVSQLLAFTDLDSVLQRVIELGARAVKAHKASFFLQDGQEVDWDHLFTSRNLQGDDVVKVVGRVMATGFAGWVVRHRRGDIIYDTEQDERWITFEDDTLPVRSVLCVPFLAQEEVIAVLTLVHPEPNHFTPYHLRLMTIVANQAAIAIQNAQLINRLHAQRRQLEAILQSMSDALLVLTPQGAIQLANAAALPLLGATEAAQVTGQRITDFIERDRLFVPVAEIVDAALAQNEQWNFEARSDLRNRDFQVTMSVWRDPLRGMMGYVIVMHDVTTLHDLGRFKDEMLRLASHDLRSPLALIAGYADMITMDLEDAASPIHDYVNIIKSSTDRMGGLIEDLLRVERIRSSPLELQEQTDLEALVKVAMVNMRPSATARNQRFSGELNLKGIPRVVIDPVLIRQAMENLIGNAIKYTPDGGAITVYASYNEHSFEFIVQDSGVGIAEEHLAYIFEPFYRVQATAAQKGSGLGLSLVKNVVERHHGQVWVESTPGVGSRFGIRLPLQTCKPE